MTQVFSTRTQPYTNQSKVVQGALPMVAITFVRIAVDIPHRNEHGVGTYTRTRVLTIAA